MQGISNIVLSLKEDLEKSSVRESLWFFDIRQIIKDKLRNNLENWETKHPSVALIQTMLQESFWIEKIDLLKERNRFKREMHNKYKVTNQAYDQNSDFIQDVSKLYDERVYSHFGSEIDRVIYNHIWYKLLEWLWYRVSARNWRKDHAVTSEYPWFSKKVIRINKKIRRRVYLKIRKDWMLGILDKYQWVEWMARYIQQHINEDNRPDIEIGNYHTLLPKEVLDDRYIWRIKIQQTAKKILEIHHSEDRHIDIWEYPEYKFEIGMAHYILDKGMDDKASYRFPKKIRKRMSRPSENKIKPSRIIDIHDKVIKDYNNGFLENWRYKNVWWLALYIKDQIEQNTFPDLSIATLYRFFPQVVKHDRYQWRISINLNAEKVIDIQKSINNDYKTWIFTQEIYKWNAGFARYCISKNYPNLTLTSYIQSIPEHIKNKLSISHVSLPIQRICAIEKKIVEDHESWILHKKYSSILWMIKYIDSLKDKVPMIQSFYSLLPDSIKNDSLLSRDNLQIKIIDAKKIIFMLESQWYEKSDFNIFYKRVIRYIGRNKWKIPYWMHDLNLLYYDIYEILYNKGNEKITYQEKLDAIHEICRDNNKNKYLSSLEIDIILSMIFGKWRQNISLTNKSSYSIDKETDSWTSLHSIISDSTNKLKIDTYIDIHAYNRWNDLSTEDKDIFLEFLDNWTLVLDERDDKIKNLSNKFDINCKEIVSTMIQFLQWEKTLSLEQQKILLAISSENW